jgi:hypothetical protein
MATVGTQLYLGDKFINSSFLGNTGVGINPFTILEIPTNGLVAWYDASNPASYPGTGTTWTDLSPLSGTGTIVGSPTFNSTTKLFTFNGSSQRVDLTNFLSGGQPTYSYYVIASAGNGGTTQVFGQGTEADNQRAFMIRISGYFGFNGYNNDNNTPSGMIVADNTLKGIALTMDNDAANQSQALRFYLNGAFVTTSGTNNGATNLNVGTTAARIASNAGNGELFNGSIGVCIAYNRVLSDAEITTINTYYSTKYTLV